MTKIFNFALKIKGVVGRVAHAKSSDPATPPKIWNVHLMMIVSLLGFYKAASACICTKILFIHFRCDVMSSMCCDVM